MTEKLDSERIKTNLKKSLKIIRNYDWLINLNSLDFYVDNQLDKLPQSWRNLLTSIDPEDFCDILIENEHKNVWPLSILALKVLLKDLNISRTPKDEIKLPIQQVHPKMKNQFTKLVKLKKRHEIEKISKLCYKNALKTKTKYIIDFGAGLGHLARTLTYVYGLKVCCLEMKQDLNDQAKNIDKQFELQAKKYHQLENFLEINQPVHITLTLTNSITPDDFIKQIINAFQIDKNLLDNFTFGIIGLHPCGDLASILMNLFLRCKEAKFLNLVGCCYLKLTSNVGYPLSNFLKNNLKFSCLTYESREISCHANEVYVKHLKSGNYNNLKIHSYRALLEKILLKESLDKKHLGLRNVKHIENMKFNEYCEKAVKNLKINLNYDEINSKNIPNYLNMWKNHVNLNTLRLFFAPLIETVILYDRILYLNENDCNVTIDAIFNPSISPRNHVTTAMKNDYNFC